MKTDFLWGVATSPYQAEGGYNGPGQPQTNWAMAEQRKEVARSGRGAEFWERYEEDFERCRQMGLNAFRLGIEWSRVQPCYDRNPGPAPPFDFEVLDHYVAMLEACRGADLEPVVTLHHFVHPAWLGADAWLAPETAAYFEEFVRVAVTYVNRQLAAPLRYFITINEPNMLALNTYFGHQFPTEKRRGLHLVSCAINNLLTAHVRAYNAIHDIYGQSGWPRPMVALNNYCSDLYWTDKFLLDLLSVAERNVRRSGVRDYIHAKIEEFEKAFAKAHIPLHKDLPYYFGALVKRLSNRLGYRWFAPEHFDSLLGEIERSPRKRLFDYLGLDYYDPFSAHAFRLPVLWDHEFKNKSFRSWILNAVTSKWWDWRVLPRGLHFFCTYYSADFGARPVLIAENGLALRRRIDNSHSHRRDRINRSQFLRLHVHEVLRILKEGLPLIGYLHWSLFDNYEWGTFTPRFGLYSLDYLRGSERHVEDHMRDRPSETYALLVAEAQRFLAARRRRASPEG